MEASVAISGAKQSLRTIIDQVPEFNFGMERLQQIHNILQKTPQETRRALREHVLAFLKLMVHKEASDIDFGGHGCMNQIWYRIYGIKKPESRLGTYATDETDVLIINLLTDLDRSSLFENRYVDFSYSIIDGDDKIRFRATAYFDMYHLALNMRLINREIRPLQNYNFHPNTLKLLSLKYVKHGLILITGITGSGKSTTLDAIIDANNRSTNAHIVIISNPVEFVHQPKMSIVRHREIGPDVKTFKDGTIQSLRQDPDIIVIGEMRDPDTISTVLEVADSGHKVFTTLHTSSATEAIDRILGETPASEQVRIRERLADVITCVISQKLIPSIDGKRILAKEVLIATAAIRAAIRNNHTDEIYQLIYQGSSYGMVTMEQDLNSLYRMKRISYNEAYFHANNKKRFEDLMKINQG